MFPINRNGKIPMYEQIYNCVRQEIETGRMKPGSRLLSVRRFAETYGISKITVEQAYAQLAAEGYIQAHNRAPYEVLPIYGIQDNSNNNSETILQKNAREVEQADEEHQVKYNFATSAMDPEGFDYKRWKRLINHVLKEPKCLMSYGEENGEYDLREAIATYVYESRGVNSNPQYVVIAGGTQILLHILMSVLLKSGLDTVNIASKEQSVLKNAFFRDTSINIMDWEGVDAKGLQGANVAYCTPSHIDDHGGVLSIGERLSILEWANTTGGYIIEDDYDSELRYYGRPISAMQGLDREGRVIYIGSVSKVLPPSIRISYMVMPKALYKIYQKHITNYRQTAGMLEQLVLAEYIQGGEWSRQIRRLRKHYQEKSKLMVELLKSEFQDKVQVNNPEGGVYLSLCLKTDLKEEELISLAEEESCAVRYVGQENGYPLFLLSFSAISTGELPEAIAALSRAWKGI